MHDPSRVVFDIHLPIPRLQRRWRKDAPKWGIRPQRRTNPENLGEFVYPWFRPQQWSLYAFGRQVRLREFCTVWHDEPNEHDSGTICGRLPSGSDLTWKNVRWAWKHRHHLHYQFPWWQAWCRRRYQRCAHCNGRSTKDNPVNVGGGWHAEKVKWNQSRPDLHHHQCAAAAGLRRALDEAYEALRTAQVSSLDLELRGMQSTKAWRIVYDVDQWADRTEAPK